jgi:hypothetical protein
MQKRAGVGASESTNKENPDAVIQREYLLPVYQYLVIEADTFEEACAEAVGPEHDWDNAEEDYDGSLSTTITNAKMVPGGTVVGPFHDTVVTKTQEMTLGTFLYENEEETGPVLPIPDLHRTEER